MARRKEAPVHPFDRLHGTDTSGLLPAEWLHRSISAGMRLRETDLTAYYGVAPSILHRLLQLWREELSPQAPVEQTVFWTWARAKAGRFCSRRSTRLRVSRAWN